MTYPAFFDEVAPIIVHDSLAQCLGASSDGVLTYHYLDAVRLAGHSCPTVASAYLMTRRALQVLFPDDVPERGEIEVSFAKSLDEGVTGVIASVIGLITGAAGPGGFKGIGGRFKRQDLLHFDSPVQGEVCFQRKDNGAKVELVAQLSLVPPNPLTSTLLQRILAGTATLAEAREFAELWQDRVKKILLEHADDPELIVVKR